MNFVVDWFYFINLDTCKRRRQQILSHFTQAGINAIRHTAVEGQLLNANELIADGTLAEWPPNSKGDGSSMGNLGCYLSHVGLWQRIFDEEDPDKTAAIFEDDIVVPMDFVSQIQDNCAGIPKDWDVVKLAWTPVGVHNPFNQEISGRQPGQSYFSGIYLFGMHAYVVKISSIPKLLEAFLPITLTRGRISVDSAMGRHTTEGKVNLYVLKNGIVRHEPPDQESSVRSDVNKKFRMR